MAMDTAGIRKRLEPHIGPVLRIGSSEELRKGQKDFRKWGSGLIVGSREWVVEQLAAKIRGIRPTSLSCEPAKDYDWQTSKLEGFCVRIQALMANDTLAGYYVGRIGDDEYGAFGYGIMEDASQRQGSEDGLCRGSQDSQALTVKLKVLVAVAKADGHISEKERRLLEDFCRQYGLDLAQLSAAVAGPITVVRGELPDAREDKYAMFVDVLRIAVADGPVMDGERSMIGKIAKALGLDRDEVKECATKAAWIARGQPVRSAMGQQPSKQMARPPAAGSGQSLRTSQDGIEGADVRANVAAAEPWEKFRQYVSLPSGASDVEQVSNGVLQFMFASRRDADHILSKLPTNLRSVLDVARRADAGTDPGSGKYVASFSRASMAVGQAKSIMNHVVLAGGEVYEALLS